MPSFVGSLPKCVAQNGPPPCDTRHPSNSIPERHVIGAHTHTSWHVGSDPAGGVTTSLMCSMTLLTIGTRVRAHRPGEYTPLLTSQAEIPGPLANQGAARYDGGGRRPVVPGRVEAHIKLQVCAWKGRLHIGVPSAQTHICRLLSIALVRRFSRASSFSKLFTCRGRPKEVRSPSTSTRRSRTQSLEYKHIQDALSIYPITRCM